MVRRVFPDDWTASAEVFREKGTVYSVVSSEKEVDKEIGNVMRRFAESV